MVISCDTDESSKFKNLVNERLGDKYVVKQLASFNPRVKVVGISEKLEDEVLLNYIKVQNKSLISATSECKLVNLKPVRKNHRIYQAILQVDKSTYDRMLNCGKLFVGYDYCSIYDAIDIRRCFKCCGFHHVANQCTNNTHICPKCSGNHTLKECNADFVKCTLCMKLKSSLNKDINVNHAVWDLNCTVYKQALQKFRSNVLGTE